MSGPHLFLLVARSVHSVLGSPVFLEVPVLPGALVFPVDPALRGVRGPYGWTLVDWVRGSGWSCNAPCGLRRDKEKDNMAVTHHTCLLCDYRQQQPKPEPGLKTTRPGSCVVTHSGSAAHRPAGRWPEPKPSTGGRPEDTSHVFLVFPACADSRLRAAAPAVILPTFCRCCDPQSHTAISVRMLLSVNTSCAETS